MSSKLKQIKQFIIWGSSTLLRNEFFKILVVQNGFTFKRIPNLILSMNGLFFPCSHNNVNKQNSTKVSKRSNHYKNEFDAILLPCA